MLGKYGDGAISCFSTKVSPHVLVKKSVSLLVFLGSLSTAGKFTVDEYTVHFSSGWLTSAAVAPASDADDAESLVSVPLVLDLLDLLPYPTFKKKKKYSKMVFSELV